MDTVLLSTAYLPPISWMTFALHHANTIIEIHETYPKQTIRNRCNIATSSGVLSLTVPVKRIQGNHTKTVEIAIDNSRNWQKVHWRSIVTAYNKTPYFLFYRDLFEPVYKQKFDRLIDLNHELLLVMFKALQTFNTDVVYTECFSMNPDFTDLRNSFSPGGKPTHYFKTEFPRYIQAFEETIGFLPDLSSIDLLFNIGPDARKYFESMKIGNEV
jgi:hypothetical protein